MSIWSSAWVGFKVSSIWDLAGWMKIHRLGLPCALRCCFNPKLLRFPETSLCINNTVIVQGANRCKSPHMVSCHIQSAHSGQLPLSPLLMLSLDCQSLSRVMMQSITCLSYFVRLGWYLEVRRVRVQKKKKLWQCLEGGKERKGEGNAGCDKMQAWDNPSTVYQCRSRHAQLPLPWSQGFSHSQ